MWTIFKWLSLTYIKIAYVKHFQIIPIMDMEFNFKKEAYDELGFLGSIPYALDYNKRFKQRKEYYSVVDKDFRFSTKDQYVIEDRHLILTNGVGSITIEDGRVLNDVGRNTLYTLDFDKGLLFFGVKQVGTLERINKYYSPWTLIHLKEH